MYVYVAEFENKPELVKIGISKNVSVRIKSLESSHGRCTSLHEVFVGPTYHKVEKAAHRKFHKFRKNVVGDGGSEFFSKCIKTDVLDFLQIKMLKEQKEIDHLRDKIAEREEKLDRIIHKTFVSRDTTFKSKLTEWNRNPTLLKSGLLEVACAEGLGFPLDDCLMLKHKKAILVGFTTLHRVRLLYDCSMDDKVKSSMQSRISHLEESVQSSKLFKKVGSYFGPVPINQEMVESIMSVSSEAVKLFDEVYYLRDNEAWYEHPQLRGLYKLLKQS